MAVSRKTQWLTVLAVLSTAISSIGCGINRRYANDSIRQLPYSHVAIQYTVKDRGIVLAGADSLDEANRLSASSDAQQTLSISYPHPNPKLGRNFAEVTLYEVTRQDSSTAAKSKQLISGTLRQLRRRSRTQPSDGSVLRMALKREELELLLRDIVADGFFDREQRPGGVGMEVTLGSRSTNKNWDHVAALDRLITRIQEDNRKQAKRISDSPKAHATPAELLAPTSAANDLDPGPAADSVELVPDPARF